MKIEDYIKENLLENTEVIKNTVSKCSDQIKEAALAMVDVYYKKGGSVFLFGNGGSAADAQHIAGELFCLFKLHRIPLPANALATNNSVITAISNDLGFENVFSRQLEALATSRDLVIGISTSGNSLNVLKGIQVAKSRGITTIGLTGKNGGKLAKMVDIPIQVPSTNTARIQEAHTLIGHILCGAIEEILFSKEGLEI